MRSAKAFLLPKALLLMTRIYTLYLIKEIKSSINISQFLLIFGSCRVEHLLLW